jgi:hypothetical protein
MDKQEFKRRWESGDDGGGITLEAIASCYVEWGLGSTPRVQPPRAVIRAVLKAADTNDQEDWAQDHEEF